MLTRRHVVARLLAKRVLNFQVRGYTFQPSSGILEGEFMGKLPLRRTFDNMRLTFKHFEWKCVFNRVIPMMPVFCYSWWTSNVMRYIQLSSCSVNYLQGGWCGWRIMPSGDEFTFLILRRKDFKILMLCFFSLGEVWNVIDWYKRVFLCFLWME